MAQLNVKKILLKVVGDSEDAKRKLAEVTDDLREFDRFSAEARADVKTEGATAKLDQLRQRLIRLGNQEATPRVKIAMGRTLEQIERLEAQLARLDAKDVNVDVNVDRDGRARNAVGGLLGGIAGGVAAGIGGLLGNLPGIGGLFQGLTSTFGTTAIGAGAATVAILALAGALAALVASLGAAIAGLGALTIALAGALGPAVLVIVGAFARFAAIVKAVKDHTANAGGEARGLAGAQDQLAAATDAVSQAQSNLREQTTAAYRAWHDSIETVKDDLLSVEHAQLGIEQGHLRTRQALKALRDFRADSGTDGKAFDSLFRRFSDVNFTGDPSRLVAALGKQGKNVSGDDSLRLQQLILDLKEAKLGEKDATDHLHDSNTKLTRDRQVQADFIAHGLKAYGPYNAAIRQLATSQRSLASAQRAGAAATERQSNAWDELSPAEQKFATALEHLGDTLKKVFTPVMSALLGGVTRGLQDFAKAATDPKVKGALVDTGKALGDTFAQVVKALTSPGARDAFARFAAEGVRIIPKLARAFTDLLTFLGRIGLAATGKNGLGGLIDGLVGFTDHLERSTRNSKDLREKVQGLVDTFKDWLAFLLAVSGLLLKIGTALAPIGTAIVEFLTHPLQGLKDLSEHLGITGRDLKDLRTIAEVVGRGIGEFLSGFADSVKGFLTVIRGFTRIIVGLLTGDFKEAWEGVKDTVRGAINAAKGVLRGAIAPFYSLGHSIGKAVSNGIHTALHGVLQFFKDRVGDFISAYNAIPLLPNVDNPFESNSVGRVGPSAPNPLNPGNGLGRLPKAGKSSLHESISRSLADAVSAALPRRGLAFAGGAGGPGGFGDLSPASLFGDVTVPITVAGGGPPDVETLGELLEGKLRRVGRRR